MPAATLIMLASATPQLKKRPGACCLNLSNSLLPMSPDSRTTRESFAPSRVISSANAFPCVDPQLAFSSLDFIHRWDAVMPVVVVLHERYPFAFDRMRDQSHRLAAAIRHPLQQSD